MTDTNPAPLSDAAVKQIADALLVALGAAFPFAGEAEPAFEQTVEQAPDVEPAPPVAPPPLQWFYSPGNGGFYRSDLSRAIPDDAVEISETEHQELLAGQSEGREIRPGTDGRPELRDPPPPSADQVLAQFRAAVQGHIDQVAGQRGYDSGTSCASYAGSTVPQWEAEAAAFILWRDSVWQTVLSLFAEVQAGTAAIPALEDLIADLPTIDWPA